MAVTAIKLHGVKEALHAFGEMPRRLRHRHLRIALNAGGGILKRTAQSYAPKEVGLLRQSIGVKVKIPDASFNTKHHGRPAYVVIGPRRGFSRGVFNNKRGRTRTLTDAKSTQKQFLLAGGKATIRNPSRYAHLVEFGTKKHLVSVRGARVLSNGAQTFGRRAMVGAQSNTFIRAAIMTSGAAAQAAVTRKLQSAVQTEALSLSRR